MKSSQSTVKRSIGRALSFIGLLLMMPVFASAQVGVAQVEIIPSAPTPQDSVAIKLSGEWPEGCVPRDPSVTVSNNQIRISTIRPAGACTAAITPFTLNVPVGRLAAGIYDVVAVHLVAGVAREYGRKSFTVGRISDGAYPLLTRRVTANRDNFFIYQNADSAFNRGEPKLFGMAGRIRFNAAWVDVPGAPDPNAFDSRRGTVFRVIFDRFSAGEFAGINFEEGGTLNYDLSNATSLLFDLRTPTPGGVKIYLGIGGLTFGPLTVPQSDDFRTYEVRFNPADFTNKKILFAVSAGVDILPGGGEVLLDNIRLAPVPLRQQTDPKALSIPLSYEVFGVTPANSDPFPIDQQLANFGTIYETALCIIALIHRGEGEDLNNARRLADALDYALRHDNGGLPIPPSPNGGRGLHSAMSGGDIALFNSQGNGQGQAGEVRLAGFTCDYQNFKYCAVEDGASGGNNAFALISLLLGYKQFNDVRYLEDARMIARWLVDNLEDKSGTGYGGYFVGYESKGAKPPKPLQTGKSVENNADIFAALNLLGATERKLGRTTEAAVWEAKAKVAGDFVFGLFDQQVGRFYAGTVPADKPLPVDFCSDGARKGNDIVNVCDYLDANTFSILALAASPVYRNSLDWRKPLQFVFNNFAKTVTAAGQEFRGFNLVKQPASGADGVAWEFTAQVALAARFVDGLYGETNFQAVTETYLNQLRRAQSLAPFGDGVGIVAATVQNGDRLPPADQCIATPFQCIPQRTGVAATAFAILAERGVSPFEIANRVKSVSAATYLGDALAVESIVAAFGTDLATATIVAAATPLPTELGGSTVRVRDSAGRERLAPLFFVSPTQINYQIPPETAVGLANLVITSGNGTVSTETINVVSVAPGIFTTDASGRGLPAAVALRTKADGSQAYEEIYRFDPVQNRLVAVPIDLGEITDQVVLVLFGTGWRNRSSLSAVDVRIGELAASVLYAGAQPTLVGVDQINVLLPRSLAGRGHVDVIATIDGFAANTVSVSIK
ncbi:MAG: hypothetical protein ABI977_11740 [Acidobacteriota bacterium]